MLLRTKKAIAIAVHNNKIEGIPEWSVCRSFNEMFRAVAPVIDGYGIDLKYFLIDVNRYPEEVLTELPNVSKPRFY